MGLAMKVITYISPGDFTAEDTLVWDVVRREARRLGLPDELYIVNTGRRNPAALNRICAVLEVTVGVHGFQVVGPRHPLFQALHFDRQLRIGRMTVRDDGIVQVRPRVWSSINADFRDDQDNLDDEAMFPGIKEFKLTARQMSDLGMDEVEEEPAPSVRPTAWSRLLEDDAL